MLACMDIITVLRNLVLRMSVVKVSGRLLPISDLSPLIMCVLLGNLVLILDQLEMVRIEFQHQSATISLITLFNKIVYCVFGYGNKQIIINILSMK